MKVLVDTPVWSMTFRRTPDPTHAAALGQLSGRGDVQLLGAVRQEVLSGIREGSQFQFLRERLAAFPDVPLVREDYERAAAMFNRCRSRGVQGSNTDFLICAVAAHHDFLIYTTDGDFKLFAKYLHVKLFVPS